VFAIEKLIYGLVLDQLDAPQYYLWMYEKEYNGRTVLFEHMGSMIGVFHLLFTGFLFPVQMK